MARGRTYLIQAWVTFPKEAPRNAPSDVRDALYNFLILQPISDCDMSDAELQTDPEES